MFAVQAWYVRDLCMGRADRTKHLTDMEGKTWTDEDFMAAHLKIASNQDGYVF